MKEAKCHIGSFIEDHGSVEQAHGDHELVDTLQEGPMVCRDVGADIEGTMVVPRMEVIEPLEGGTSMAEEGTSPCQ